MQPESIFGFGKSNTPQVAIQFLCGRSRISRRKPISSQEQSRKTAFDRGQTNRVMHDHTRFHALHHTAPRYTPRRLQLTSDDVTMEAYYCGHQSVLVGRRCIGTRAARTFFIDHHRRRKGSEVASWGHHGECGLCHPLRPQLRRLCRPPYFLNPGVFNLWSADPRGSAESLQGVRGQPQKDWRLVVF